MVEVEPVCSYQAPDSWRKKDSVFNLGGLPPTFLKNCKGFRPDRDTQKKLQDSGTVETPRNHEHKITP